MNRKLSRRQILLTSGLATATGLAGCNGLQSGETTDSAATTGTATATPPDGSNETATDCGQTTIEESITTDTTFRSSCTYTLAGGIDVAEGATLTVEAGATVEAQQGSYLYVQEGTIVAQGTAASPIEFRGTDNTPGHWNGIRVNTDNPNNEMTHVTVSDGGGSTFKAANLTVGASGTGTRAARVTIRNCEFTNSAAAGVRVTSEGALDAFANNRLANNDGAPLDLHPRQLGSLDGSSTFENNGDSFVAVRWDSTDRQIQADGTWPKMSIPYRFAFGNDDWVVLQSEIDIEAGARFEFGQAKGLRVGTDGTLVAVGDSDDRIEFVGATDEPGFWNGIRVFSPSQDNELRHVRISNGGATTFQKADLLIANSEENPARATVRNCELTHSSFAGVFVPHTGELVDFGDNRLANNDGPPLRMHPRRLASLEASSTFENNGDSFVGVQWDSTDRNVRDGGTWKELSIPYRFEFANDDWVDLRDRIEVEPGAAFEFGQGKGLRVKEGGALVAEATEQNPIVFEGAQSQQGYWNGIRVSNGVGSRFSKIEISDGGATTFRRANIGVFGDGTAASVSESTVANSAGYGLWQGEDASLGVGGNSFFGNREGAVERAGGEN